jgi:Carboxypeptidase regulatory-like domain
VDADGDYALAPRTDGSYRIGFVDASAIHADEYWRDSPLVAYADDVVVADRRDVPVDAELALAGLVMGRVTDPAGVGVPDVEVTLHSLVRGAWVPVSGAFTDGDGFYDAGRLRAGTYRAQFTAPPGTGHGTKFFPNAGSLVAAGDFTVTAGNITPAVNVTLSTPVDPYAPPVEPTTPPVVGPTTPTPTVTPTGPTTGMPTATPTVTPAAPGSTQAPPAPIRFGTPGGKPVTKGKAKVGGTLKAVLGAVTPSSATVRIQWFANGKRIKGATKPRLKVTRTYAGTRIHVQVRATAPGYDPVVARTKPAKIRR